MKLMIKNIHRLTNVARCLSHGQHWLLTLSFIILHFSFSIAQEQASDPNPIVIGGNVYGGGNKGNVDGSTSVTVKAGNLQMVFGGARQANVGGNSYVHIDGKDATNYMLINYVFGGNDIAGRIGSIEALNNKRKEEVKNLSEEEQEALLEGELRDLPAEIAGNKDGVDLTWNSYLHLSTKIKTAAIPYTQEECTAYNTSYGYEEGDVNFRTTDDIKTPAVPADDNRKVFIGQAYAGGNGDYDYDPVTNVGGETTAYNVYKKPRKSGDKPIATIAADASMPNLAKAYLDVQGGTIDYAYGGGNNATVTEKTVIHIDNPSEVVTNIYTDKDGVEDKTVTDELFKAHPENYPGINTLLTDERIKAMGINAFFSSIESTSFQMGRLFGGNNTAEMAIMPTWNLQSGLVRNLYSGGNKGTMTSPKGLLLEIPAASHIVVNNLYGGCRMANVVPKNERGDTVTVENLEGYKFPKGLSARLLVRGGDINNVYGGNDVTGTVYGGNAIGIYTTIRGDVYGGGNGAYPYTNTLENDSVYGDLYFEQGDRSVLEALNAFRPNAEQVSIRLAGKARTTGQPDYTIIKGSVFVGGNCATLDTKKSDPLVELKMGSYVIANKVFLGNNGAGMIDEDNLKYYAGLVDDDGNLLVDDDGNVLSSGNGSKFSTINLTDDDDFKNYMDAVAVDLQSAVVFDDKDNDPADYVDNSSYVGSFYCGGNVGSMSIPGTNTYKINRRLNIFEKFVGGCNNANIKAGPYNAAYEGGVLGKPNVTVNGVVTEVGDRENFVDENGNIRDRLVINLDNLTITPLRWDDKFDIVTHKKLAAGKTYYTDAAGTHSFVSNGTEIVDGTTIYYEKKGDTYVKVPLNTLTEGREYYYTDLRSSKFIADGTEVFDATNQDPKKTYYELTTVGEQLIWNTAKWDYSKEAYMRLENAAAPNDDNARLLGGNVYGGCYSSGHVNGNVVININEDVLQRENVFGTGTGLYGRPASGVELENQREDLMALALTVFGAGYGEETEIWGSTTVNLNKGYAFQIFGGGEKGIVGKKTNTGYDSHGAAIMDYVYNPAYSSTVNMKGQYAGYSEDETGNPLAEAEYIYGGGNEGNVCGDTRVYLGNGRANGVFGGASNADILGGAEVYIGYNDGFPWVINDVYGGNDFGGTIKGNINHSDIIKSDWITSPDALLLKSSTYVKYIQGHTDSIFGGCYGSYDYTDRIFSKYTDANGKPLEVNGKPIFNFPHLDDNSFVHFTPVDNSSNHINHIFGGSEGFPGDVNMNDAMQRESYVLIDDSQTKDADRFAAIDIYGGGAFAGVGIPDSLGAGRTKVDLYAGTFRNVYGGSNQEGLIGLTQVNVPTESTVKVNAIFGGSKGYDPDLFTNNPELSTRYCDNYITCVDYKGANAIVNDGIYGGNENSRISCDTYINIEAPVLQSNGYQATIYGAGYGRKTVSGRTNIFMNNGGMAYKVFGGGRDGNAFNFASLKQWLANQFAVNHLNDTDPTTAITNDVVAYGAILRRFGDYITRHKIRLPSNIGTYVNASGVYDGTYTNDIMPTEEKPMPTYHQTNVHLMKGSTVTGYAYGGGYGSNAIVGGTTYVELKGGMVDRDIYGGGQGGQVYDEFGFAKDADATNDFVAATNVYIEGGMARNVYGGGYLGHVGKHEGDGDGDGFGDVYGPYADDIPAVANVIIGKTGVTDFYTGNPAVTRNVYGGGEGGSVFGKANVTINNGMVGYRYKNTGTEQEPVYKYVEELADGDRNIDLAGNVFGGGYVVNSYVDSTDVKMYGGQLRGSLFGGGEVGPIGRGTMKTNAPTSGGMKQGLNNEATIYKAGKTHVEMYDGHVLRNVFGGGRGKDSWGGDGTMYMLQNMSQAEFDNLDLNCKGFIFGQTEVYIHGGEVGTEEGLAKDYGNVFGGCDEGSVYSAYEDADGNLRISTKDGVRYDKKYEGYYFEYGGDISVKINEDSSYKLEDGYVNKNVGTTDDPKWERIYTEDCKVVVEPWLQVKKNAGITFDADGDNIAETYIKGDYIPTAYLNTLPQKEKNATAWPIAWDDVDVGQEVTTGGKTVFNERGIYIHNAVFAGGNTATGSSTVHAKDKTVFGNVSASIHDVYNRDFITIGTNGIGGLYGDGNLTFADGYRELNITNYGTDYYHLKDILPTEEYDILPDREKAYYELKYKCVIECTDYDGTKYLADATLPLDELIALFTKPDGKSVMAGNDSILVTKNGKKVPNSKYWAENGVVSTYAGRYMNTIQRADFCGVYGSRMVMKGAPDRVPEKIDYTNYTINRVREVSLNKKTDHGNYFGIYNIVNYLGALTSDVRFNAIDTSHPAAVRTTEATGSDYTADGKTFKEWKAAHSTERSRNNGNCHNKLALASGVYLELTTEESTGDKLTEKVWGPITGVVELDLINVQPGIGGGFVYAKNIHGVPKATGHVNTTMTALNKGAATKWDYDYLETNPTDNSVPKTQETYETSGNFINSSVSQPIIDDCYNASGRYEMNADGTDKNGRVPAHYWFIQGQVYVYDQYISAYTGSPNAYSETVELPITLAAASNGKMTLMDVQPNLYAYYTVNNTSEQKPLTADSKIVVNDVEYKLNDPISYWDWYLLPASTQNLFVEKTYVTTKKCQMTINGEDVIIPADTVLLPAEYNNLLSKAVMKDLTDDKIENPVPAVVKVIEDEEGNISVEKDENGYDVYQAFDDVFHESNNMRHDTGYLLTYKVTNPDLWNQWYTKIEDDELKDEDDQVVTDAQGNPIYVRMMKQTKDGTVPAGYEDGPTYHAKQEGLYGQQEYKLTDIIPNDVYQTYQGIANNASSLTDKPQAAFERAYVTKEYVEATDLNQVEQHMQKGTKLAKSEYSTAEWSTLSSKVEEAYVCTSTIEISSDSILYPGDLITKSQKDYYSKKLSAEDNKLIVEAYYCTTAGYYGGDYYTTNKNHRAHDIWSSMSADDRDYFEYNYDALDLLIDPSYGKKADGTRQKEGQKYQYDGEENGVGFTTKEQAAENPPHYSLKTPIDYTATYNGTAELMYTPDEGSTKTPATGQTQVNALDANHPEYKELTRTEYESLPNEQRYYVPIKVEEAGNCYVVKETFIHSGGTLYAVGTVLSKEKYDKLTQSEQNAYITTLTFTSTDVNKTYYYCREEYEVNEKGEGQTPTPVTTITQTNGGGGITTTTLEDESTLETVTVGTIINANSTTGVQGSADVIGYSSLPNKQLDFIIHGTSPMETSTLYVTRNSNIEDLSKEKIITVIYQYDYDESDKEGKHFTPISERHIVKIHITFKAGIPIVDDIHAPSIVIPGTSVTMGTPRVTSGGPVVTGGGWELFERKQYAESHINGIEYTPNKDPLYWYQDGYLIAYYATTSLGKTYSNAVPVSVANYHDLKKVMDDKKNHLHVDYDRSRLKRNSKVYINDYSGNDKDGLDLFKDFYDLSVYDVPASNIEEGLIKTGDFTGHKPLNISESTGVNSYDDVTYTRGVKAGTNLDFIMRTDIDHTAPSGSAAWTPIGTDAQCFEGTLHGDGHTISGLDNSLFKNLCGAVYNLGVTGSFTGAGVVDQGTGYVESSWTKTTATPTKKTDSDTKNHFAVFGNPSRTNTPDLVQVVNCYYPASKDYDVPTTDNELAHGKPIAMPDKAFYDGELAYDLNNFYLYKRYYNKMGSVDPDVKEEKKNFYFTIGDDDQLTLQPYRIYGNNPKFCSSGADISDKTFNYVEDRFADGDFRFADGETTVDNERYYEWEVEDDKGNSQTKSGWFPIWPDDYLFFGQKLTFGYSATDAHQEVPTAVARFDGRLSQGTDANRVYRAPAYYRSDVMGVAHFNPTAYLAQKEKLTDEQLEANATNLTNNHPEDVITPRDAYPNMTAIDFAGHNGANVANGTYGLGTPDGTKWFYPPLLDDDGLLSITNCDETRNLLVYAPAETSNSGYANAQTYTVLNGTFTEPVFNDYYDRTNKAGNFTDGERYDRVKDATGQKITGHLVNLVQNEPKATNDHLLVDKQDFNAPIQYTFEPGYRMWYQRLPDDNEFVDHKKGWQGISLPFTAKLVTTNTKGEISHFFSGSLESKNGTGKKIGHEYWLRQYTGINEANEPNVATANFTYPNTSDGSATIDKTVWNTFLWDYYYSKGATVSGDAGPDKNTDIYRKYYSDKRRYDSYPMMTAAKPYLLGLPGQTYYEFDLSGNFEALNTGLAIEQVKKQVITFASAETGITVKVSDKELKGVPQTQGNMKFTFVPSYMNDTLKAVQVDNNGIRVSGDKTPMSYALNDIGNAYNAITWTKNGNGNENENEKVLVVAAFRPYFIDETPITTARRQTRSILFSNVSDDSFGHEASDTDDTGSLSIGTSRKKIVVTSNLREAATVQIRTTAGVTVATFDIQPGETVETRVVLSGVFIVQTADGHYTKKLSVR